VPWDAIALFTLVRKVKTGAEAAIGTFETETEARNAAQSAARDLDDGDHILLLRNEGGLRIDLVGVYARPPHGVDAPPQRGR
jgi:hypothetical protein